MSFPSEKKNGLRICVHARVCFKKEQRDGATLTVFLKASSVNTLLYFESVSPAGFVVFSN